MDLAAYFKRIDYQGKFEPSLKTLQALHRAHLLSIPYENLDIHLGKTLVLDEAAIFEKIVHQGRGGWCFEMNGLFARVLRELGFEVSLLGGAVNRLEKGNETKMEHLVLLVELDRPYLADVGFGNGFLEPLILQEGVQQQQFLDFRLERLDTDWWRYHNHKHGGPSFDFRLEPYQLSDFADKCHELQTSATSGFVRLSVCHRHKPESIISLRGAVLQTVSNEGFSEQTLDSFTAYEKIMAEQFSLRLKNLDELWEKIWMSHQDWQRNLAKDSKKG